MGCPYCMNPTKLETSIDRAIKDCGKKDKKLGEKLKIVRSFLPDYPIIAMLEAENLELNQNLILLIRDTYGILPFGDVKYKENVETDLTR